jgi:hypothetical protein
MVADQGQAEPSPATRLNYLCEIHRAYSLEELSAPQGVIQGSELFFIVMTNVDAKVDIHGIGQQGRAIQGPVQRVPASPVASF